MGDRNEGRLERNDEGSSYLLSIALLRTLGTIPLHVLYKMRCQNRVIIHITGGTYAIRYAYSWLLPWRLLEGDHAGVTAMLLEIPMHTYE